MVLICVDVQVAKDLEVPAWCVFNLGFLKLRFSEEFQMNFSWVSIAKSADYGKRIRE